MVFFTCNKCGESLKKSSVEKHYNTRCRNNPINVSCMDCQKDFHGEEYVAHIKCISEAEKYSGKNYVAKENKNSNQKKQESWTDIVRSILDSSEYEMSAETRNIFQRLQNYSNVPRKKAKFQNFTKNLRITAKQAEPVWAVLEDKLNNMKQAKQQESATAKAVEEKPKMAEKNKSIEQNGIKRKLEKDDNEDKLTKKKKKEQVASDAVVEENGMFKGAEEEKGTFEWSIVLEKIVSKRTDGIMIDKLKNKLLKKYKSKLQLETLTEKQQKKFDKKFSKNLKKCPAVQVEGEVVRPC